MCPFCFKGKSVDDKSTVTSIQMWVKGSSRRYSTGILLSCIVLELLSMCTSILILKGTSPVEIRWDHPVAMIHGEIHLRCDGKKPADCWIQMVQTEESTSNFRGWNRGWAITMTHQTCVSLHCHVCYLEGYHGTLGHREKLDTHTGIPWDMVMGGPPHLFSHLPSGGMHITSPKKRVHHIWKKLSAPDQPKKNWKSFGA